MLKGLYLLLVIFLLISDWSGFKNMLCMKSGALPLDIVDRLDVFVNLMSDFILYTVDILFVVLNLDFYLLLKPCHILQQVARQDIFYWRFIDLLGYFLLLEFKIGLIF